MDILGKARRLEFNLARTMDRAAQKLTKSDAREPLEIMHAIVDAIEERLEPAGRGKQVFPFNRIKISVIALSRETRARFEAVFDGEPSLQDRLIERLQHAGCETAGLSVKTVYVERSQSHWTRPDFHVEFDRVTATDRARPARASAPDNLKLSIVRGSAEKPAYMFTLPRINLGRCAEVRDNRNRLIRTNHVAFADGAGEPNQSVSRRHAHIEYAGESGHYRVCDDRSAHGTNVVRNGKTVAVPSGSRGIRLESGDELILGEARLRIKIDKGADR
jgi:hypothetical protein